MDYQAIRVIRDRMEREVRVYAATAENAHLILIALI